MRSATSISFIDTHGNTVRMEREQVRDYAAVRSEYLGTVLHLLNEAAHGDSELPEQDRKILHCMATDLAHDVDALLSLLTEELIEAKGDKKGGAK